MEAARRVSGGRGKHIAGSSLCEIERGKPLKAISFSVVLFVPRIATEYSFLVVGRQAGADAFARFKHG